MNETILVRETPSELRRLARAVLKGNWKKVFLGLVIYSIFTVLIPNVLTAMFDFFSSEVYVEEVDLTYTVPNMLYLYQMIMGGIFQFGLYAFILHFLRTREVNYTRLFSGFERFIPVFLISFLVGIIVGLWAILLVIPGFIAFFRYYMTMYLYHDEPRLGVLGALGTSKKMTYGNKAVIFLTLLSFVGWRILAYIPLVIFDSFVLRGSFPNTSDTILVMIEYLLMLPTYFVLVYSETTMGLLYEIMSGRLRKTPPQQMNFDPLTGMPIQ